MRRRIDAMMWRLGWCRRERYERAAAQVLLAKTIRPDPRTFYVDAAGHMWAVAETETATQRGMLCS